MGLLDWLRGGERHTGNRPRLNEPTPDCLYAIGDIHGCNDELRRLDALIAADAAARGARTVLVVTLGDYVDRGPNSAAVLDWILSRPPQGQRRIALCGNHEELMLSFLAAPDPQHQWLGLGGEQTLLSYGIVVSELFGRSRSRRSWQDHLRSVIPDEHIALLQQLPVSLRVGETAFVHAGLRSGVPFAQQDDETMLWMRPDRTPTVVPDVALVVHGHTPATEAVVTRSRICLDTGAFATGVLSAGIFTAEGFAGLIATTPNRP